MSNTIHNWGADYSTSSIDRRDTGLLLAGFFAVTVAILAAHWSPATGYETSIYTATPLLFWVGVAVAIVCALTVTFTRPTRGYRLAALLLAGEAFVAIVSLPLIRGYEFTSAGDGLSHMGWIRNVLRGEMALTDLIYPGPHTISIYVHRLFGVELEQAMMLTVVLFATAFVVFVPLVAYVLTDARTAAVVGVFSAAMFLPVNNVSGHLTFFPSTLAVFLVPFALLMAVIALKSPLKSMPTPVDVFVAIGSLGVLFVHPQQAVNLVLLFATISAGALLYRRRVGDRSYSPLLRHTNFLALAIVVWGVSHERIRETATAYTGDLISTVLEGSSSSAGSVAQRTGSLEAIGVSPLEIGLKLFLPSAIFLALTAILVTRSFVKSFRGDYDHLGLTMLGLGLGPVGVVMVLYVLGDFQTVYFRHLGFIMALVTILGAVTLAHSTEALTTHRYGTVATAAVAVVLALLLVASLLTVFPSPFIYKSNAHVTEADMSGHSTAFTYENESLSYVGIRSGPDRFRDGIEGTYGLESRDARRSTSVPFGELEGNLTDIFDGPRYLVVTRSDVHRETELYRNLRYSDRGFEMLGASPGVDRVVSNGEFRLYHVEE